LNAKDLPEGRETNNDDNDNSSEENVLQRLRAAKRGWGDECQDLPEDRERLSELKAAKRGWWTIRRLSIC